MFFYHCSKKYVEFYMHLPFYQLNQLELYFVYDLNFVDYTVYDPLK